MASTSVEIVNIALTKIGEPPITALTNNRPAALVANTLYGPTRDAVLRAHPWNCAIWRATLAETTAPLFGFTNAFALPADFLRVVRVNREMRPAYKIEGQTLLTDAETVELSYVRRIGEPLMESLLVMALATRLAAEMAEPITGSDSKTQRLFQEYETKLAEARSVDAQEEPPEELVADQWIEARFGVAEPFRGIESL